jgi:hypothetical protein
VHVLRTRRRPNVRIAAVEGLQLLAGISNLDQLNAVSGGRFSAFADHGELRGAYGPRLHGQLGHVVRLLERDPATRQALATVWRGDEHAVTSRDVPCTTTLQFLLRDGQLELRVTMRSNDLWLGVPYDWMMFSLLHRAVAEALDVPAGAYVHSVGSMHLYESNLDQARQVIEAGLLTDPLRFPPVPPDVGVSDAFTDLRTTALSILLRRPGDRLTLPVTDERSMWWYDHVPAVPPTTRLCLACRYVYDEATTYHRCRNLTERLPDRLRVATDDLLIEYRRARAKHGAYSLDGSEINDRQRIAALVEEVGEVARLLTYDHDGPDSETELYRELIQVANVAVTWATVVHRGYRAPTNEEDKENEVEASVEPVDPARERAGDLAAG